MPKPTPNSAQNLVNWNTLAIVSVCFVISALVDKLWPDLSLATYFLVYVVGLLVVGIPCYIGLFAVVKLFRRNTGDDDQAKPSE